MNSLIAACLATTCGLLVLHVVYKSVQERACLIQLTVSSVALSTTVHEASASSSCHAGICHRLVTSLCLHWWLAGCNKSHLSAMFALPMQAILKSSEDVHCAALGDWTLHEPSGFALADLASALPAGLAPEALVHRHNLSLTDVASLYRVIIAGSHGLHHAVRRVTARAAECDALLEAVWRGYEGVVRAGFSEHAPGFLEGVLRSRDDAVATSAQLTAELSAAQSQHEAVEARCARPRSVLPKSITARPANAPNSVCPCDVTELLLSGLAECKS